ncbi:bifunctional diguanylate cyclase/phosphodiesterase, partial [Tyzzerella nexilis]|nr:bifunctional diguanylate cyclase/phosphodiesterase [[Clostridium] nexile]
MVRWIRNDGTTIFPSQFIPIFEQNGFCVNLDMYMVEKVCQLLRQWIDEGYQAIP